MMSQVIEKFYEYKTQIFVMYIEFKQAFDSMDRQTIVEDARTKGVLHKLLRLIKMSLNNMQAKM